MAENAIIAKHRAYSHEIWMLFNLREYLVDQIRKKRCITKRMTSQFRPQYKFLKPYYEKILEAGWCRKDGIMLNGFFSVFNCYMEEVMAREAPEYVKDMSSDFNHVYYGHPEKPTIDMFGDGWIIHPIDTSGDIPTLMRFKEMMIDLMTRTTEHATRVLGENHHGVKKMRRILDRVK